MVRNSLTRIKVGEVALHGARPDANECGGVRY
jgi:hypothetical protein